MRRIFITGGRTPPALIDGRFSGVLATGVITEDDLVGALADRTMEDLLDEMRSGGDEAADPAK